MEASVYRSDDNNIVIDVRNNAELPVKALEVELLKMRDFSFEPYETYSVKGMIASGDSLALETPVGLIKGKKMHKYKARIAAARVAE